ncbi:EthD family reductase [Halobacteriales archaeon QS_8_69_26]|nr:MAG: EthD family reductase [Halobacteriales archaeon QS_8_69_26]
MYRHAAFLVRKDGMTHEEFVDYWQNNHTPIAREIEGVVRYTTTVPLDSEAAEFDGIADLYFEDLEALYDALGGEGSRDYDPDKGTAKEAREDVDDFLAIERRPRLIGEETVRKDEGDGPYRHTALLVRKDGMTHEEFRDHWLNEHVPIAREIPGVVRYTTTVPTDPEHAEFDGIADLYFEDVEALRAALGQEGSRDYDPDDPKAVEAREDVDDFLDLESRPRFIGETTVQKDITRE